MPEAHDDLRLHDSATTGVGGGELHFNPDHSKRIGEWIEAHWKHGPCPVCESDVWETGAVHEIPAYSPTAQVLSRAMVPVFSVFCTVCGYTILVNAVVARVVRPEEDRLTIYRGGTPL